MGREHSLNGNSAYNKKMNQYFATVNFYWFSGGERTLKQNFKMCLCASFYQEHSKQVTTNGNYLNLSAEWMFPTQEF